MQLILLQLGELCSVFQVYIPIGLDGAGDETSILDCPKNTEQRNSLSWEDVILHCRGNGNSYRNLLVLLLINTVEKECNGTDVHLVGGLTFIRWDG